MSSSGRLYALLPFGADSTRDLGLDRMQIWTDTEKLSIEKRGNMDTSIKPSEALNNNALSHVHTYLK